MKSIQGTLKTIRDITSALPVKVDIALVGGYALIAQGVERTTKDVDFCIYTDIVSNQDSKVFFELLKKHIPSRFEAQLIQGSKIPDDPFKHDLIRLIDRQQDYFRIDLLIALYKWEVEGLRNAENIKDITIPVLSKPYLATMKLQAKDKNSPACFPRRLMLGKIESFADLKPALNGFFATGNKYV